MPELPEIEGLRLTLAERLAGATVTSATTRQFALVKTYDPPLDALVGQPFTGTGRHGKHLLLHAGDDLTVAIHLGIGGRIVLPAPGKKPSRTVSLEIGLDDGGAVQIVELGTKKRSSVHVLRRVDVPGHLASLGIDALAPDFTVDELTALLRQERVQLKGFLTDQHRIAGIGNAYSDEILWEARLAPLRLTTTLDGDEVGALHEAIRSVLQRAVDRAVDDNYLTIARGDERG